MTNVKKESSRTQTWQNMTLAQYVQHRNGVPLGDSQSLRNMLQRSFGAATFAGFWQYWNPIWGYGLGKYVYAPSRRLLPPAAAFILTFSVSGAIHDLATMAVRGSFAFLFTPWFFLAGVGAVLGRAVRLDLGKRPFLIRATVNLAYLVLCLLLALLIRKEFLP